MTKPTSAKAAGQETPSLRQRAAQARDAAGRFLRRAVGQPAGQPQPASLPPETPEDRRADAFPADGAALHDGARGQPERQGRATAAGGDVPRQGQDMGRHETFENAAPIAAELLAGTILGRAAEPDPALTAINAHQAAYAVWAPLAAVQDNTAVGSPEHIAASAAEAGPMRAEIAAYNAVIAARPTTAAGLRALAAYLPDAVTAVSLNDPDDDAAQALRAICGGVLALVSSDQAAGVEPTDWHSPPPGFMASPAIEPTSFACVEQGIRIEANRLLGIALAEQRRRQTMGIEGHSRPWDAEDDARTRKALHLDALAAIACPGSIAVAGTRYVPESEHTHAEREGRVIAGGIEHGDGTISYCDAGGTLRRRPVEHWVNFIVMHLHAKVQGEIARRRVIEANHLSQDEHAVWEAGIRRALRADAVFALAFHPQRAFAAAEALRSGAEPIDAEVRASGEADLLALLPEWEAARDAYALRHVEQAAVESAAQDTRPGPAPEGSGADWQTWFERKNAWIEESGIAAAEDASTEACAVLGEVEDRIAELPAASLAGLKFKARVAQRLDDIDITWPDGLGEGLVRDILAFQGPAIGRPDLTDPDALATAILDHWTAWAQHDGSEETPEAEAAWTRNDARRNELLDAAEALPATSRAIVAKALAVAWMEWVVAEQPGRPRDAYDFSGRLVFDIHTAAAGRPVPEAGARPPLECSGPRIVDRIDFTALSLEELRVLHDTADMVGGVAYAAAWQGRCHRRGTPVHLGVMNAAGDLMHWLGDALTEVESRAIREAERRRPASQDDCAIRLELVAPGIIQNGDPEELAAFARELVAHATAEATRS